jgi:hypothetical protein
MNKCSDCIHAYQESIGDGYNEPNEIEYGCKVQEEVSESSQKSIDKALLTNEPCWLFNGGICDICKTKIKKHDVLWVHGMYSSWRCCSQKCEDKAKQQNAKEYADYKLGRYI